MSRWQWHLDTSSTYVDMLNDLEHERCKGYLWSSRSMIKKACNFQRYSLFNILLGFSESFAHSLVYQEIIDDFCYWLVLGDIITWVHLCVAMVTTLHQIYLIIFHQLQRNLYQVIGIIVIPTCQNYVEYLSRRPLFHLFYVSLWYRPRGNNEIFFSLNKNNQNKAVIRITYIVRQGFICKHRFFNVLILPRFFFVCFCFCFLCCVCYS